jgi:hypothetical protein
MFAGLLNGQQLPERATVEVYRLGGADVSPEYAFPEVPRLVITSDGRVYARLPASGIVVVFDDRGRPLRSIGRKGAGPGEFEFVIDHGLLAADTLWVRNAFTPRISLFTETGEYVSTASTPFNIPVRSFSAPVSITGYMADGRAYLLIDADVIGVQRRIRLPVLPGNRTLSRYDTLTLVNNPAGVFIPELGTFGPNPIKPSPLVDFARDGSGVAIAEWTQEAPGSIRVRRITPNGMTQWTQTLTIAAPRMTRHVRDKLVPQYMRRVERILETTRRLGRPVPTTVRNAVNDALYLPEWIPPVRTILAGVDGFVWLEQVTGLTGGRWLALVRFGTPRFELKLPATLTLQQASQTHIWATMTDELDVPFIVCLKIVQPG